MASSGEDTKGSKQEDLSEERLWEQYGHALDEYRFQVDLNWKRAQYFFVLDAALLVAAVGVSATAPGSSLVLVLVIFVAGVVVAAMALLANATQHGYYRAARDVKLRLEERLSLSELALATTPAMGSGFRRFGRVRTFQTGMMVFLLGAHLTGFGFTAAQELGKRPALVQVVLRLDPPVIPSSAPVPVVVSRGTGDDAEVIRTAIISYQGSAAVRLQAGTYRVSALRGEICEQVLAVGSDPLQELTLFCRR